jgi:hypothetical protein
MKNFIPEKNCNKKNKWLEVSATPQLHVHNIESKSFIHRRIKLSFVGSLLFNNLQAKRDTLRAILFNLMLLWAATTNITK